MKNTQWIAQKNEAENGIAAIQNLIALLEVPVFSETIVKELTENTNYPSILSLSDVLNKWNIDNMTVRLEAEDLHEIPLPAIAHLKKIAENPTGDKEDQPSNYFVVLTAVTKDAITYINPEEGYITEPIQLFLKKWSGVLMLVEKKVRSGEHGYSKKLVEEKIKKATTIGKIASIIVVLGVLIGYGIYQAAFLGVSIFALKIIGFALSLILIKFSLQKDNTLVAKVCNLGKKETATNDDCVNGVLDSPAATIAGVVSMSEVGLLYFAITSISVTFGLLSGEIYGMLKLLAVVNLTTLAYSFFSIYYQGVVLKKWCRICVAIQVLFWLEFAVLFKSWSVPLSSINTSVLIAFVFSVVAPVLLWLVIRPAIMVVKEVDSLKDRLAGFEQNPFVFKGALTMASQKVSFEKIKNEVVIGNPEAANTLIIVTDPFCKHCQNAHTILEEALPSFANNTQVVFRFPLNELYDVAQKTQEMQTHFNELSEEDKVKFIALYGPENSWETLIKNNLNHYSLQHKIVSHLVTLGNQEDQEPLLIALNQLFSMKEKSKETIDSWIKKAIINDSSTAIVFENYAAATKKWLDEEKLFTTPTFAFNGSVLNDGVSLIKGIAPYLELKEYEAKENSLAVAH